MSDVIDCPRCQGLGVNYGPTYFDFSARCLLCRGVGKVVKDAPDHYRPATEDEVRASIEEDEP